MEYDSRTVLNIVRTALEEKAQRDLGGTGNVTAAHEVADKTMTLFVMLRDAYLLMGEVNEIWLANDISAQVIAAAQAGQPLAGYSPMAWAQWGAILPAVQAFMNASYAAMLPDGTTNTETPRQTLMRRYVQEVQA